MIDVRRELFANCKRYIQYARLYMKQISYGYCTIQYEVQKALRYSEEILVDEKLW